jgi:hypothetical protein
MNLITTVNGHNLDLDSPQGQYDYLGEFLSEYAANGDVWKCLSALRARIAELEVDTENQSSILYIVTRDNELMQKRIAELEAAAQWHPASAPPEELQNTGHSFSRHVEVQYENGNVSTDCYDHERKLWSHDFVVRWRDLPQRPEKGSGT